MLTQLPRTIGGKGTTLIDYHAKRIRGFTNEMTNGKYECVLSFGHNQSERWGSFNTDKEAIDSILSKLK